MSSDGKKVSLLGYGAMRLPTVDGRHATARRGGKPADGYSAAAIDQAHLNKQVAYMGKISFCEGKVILGTIKVVIETDEPDALIDTVAPETVDGEEVLL